MHWATPVVPVLGCSVITPEQGSRPTQSQGCLKPMELSLLPVAQDGDERAGFPSASEFSRLMKCRASFLLSQKAYELGQVAHERSDAALVGTKKHLANVEGPEILSPRERADWEQCQRKRDAFVKSWINGSDQPVQSIQEERLWLRKGIRPLLSGKPDEVLRQGARVAVLDHRYGSYRIYTNCILANWWRGSPRLGAQRFWQHGGRSFMDRGGNRGLPIKLKNWYLGVFSSAKG